MRIILYILAWLWSFPLSLLMLLVSLPCGPRGLRMRAGVLELRVRRLPYAGMTWGRVILYRRADWKMPARLRRHEHRHVWWCDRLGVFAAPAYGVASLISLARKTGLYQGNWFERDARAHEEP